MSETATVRHVVLMRIDPELDPADRDRLDADLGRLVDEHPHAICGSRHLSLGRKAESPISATWMVSMDFASMDDFEKYLASPLHTAFLADHQRSMTSLSAIQVPL